MKLPRLRALLWLIAFVLAAVAIRLPFATRELWSLDEGCTFTMAEQVLHGDLLYRDAADHRGPLMPYLKAAIFIVAGDWNAHAAHTVLAVAFGVCAFVLWRMARRLGDNLTGAAAAGVFTVLSFVMLDKGDALSFNTGWCVAIFSTLGFGAFVWALSQPTFRRMLPAGGLFGAAFLCKQPALLDFFVTWVLLGMLALELPTRRRAVLEAWLGLLTGATVPVIAFVIYFAAHGALADFWYYAFTYNTKVYIPAVPVLQRWAAMKDPFILVWLGSPVLAVAGGFAAIGLLVVATRSLWRKPLSFPVLPWLILGWCAAGVLSTGLSGRNFSHYSAQAVPGFSLACGWALANLLRVRPGITQRRSVRVLLSSLVAAIAIAASFDCVRRARQFEAQDGAVPEVGRLIQSLCPPQQRLFVWGYFPEMYFFAHRLPATRFVYTNFVTGMIPWTNLDPLVDTTQTAVPNADGQLAADWNRHPPAVVVDTRGLRGYIKYPLHDHPVLWPRIRESYVQVAVAHADRLGVRLFQRVEAPQPEKLDSALPLNPSIKLAGYRAFQRAEPPRLHVTAPAGVRRIEIFAADVRVAALDHPLSEPVDLLFFANATATPGTLFRAVITTGSGPSVSEPMDFGSYVDSVLHEPLLGPELRLERFDLRPLSVDTLGGKPAPHPQMPGFWKITAPMELDYTYPARLQTLDFTHGLEMAAWGHSDGYDLIVEHRADDGRRTELLRRRLYPQTSQPDREVQKVHLALPLLGPGRLVFRFLAGEKNNADFDWIYLGEIRGTSPGPILRLAEGAVLPIAAVTRGREPMKENKPGIWTAHTPSRIEWPRPRALQAIAFHYGLEDGAIAQPTSHSDGVEVVVELAEANGQTHPLFSRLLEPYNHPDQRGPQSALVTIPAETPGDRLILRVEPGPNHDPSWDWAWLSDIGVREKGPFIELPDGHVIPPLNASELGHPHIRFLQGDRWGAHANAAVEYSRPTNLQAVTFHYGLSEGADRDEAGHQRSDGVDVIVVFQPTGKPPVELFRRTLDPFHRAADLGEQTSTVTLPGEEEGRVVFKITPGEAGNNSFDWAYWGRLEGKLVP